MLLFGSGFMLSYRLVHRSWRAVSESAAFLIVRRALPERAAAIALDLWTEPRTWHCCFFLYIDDQSLPCTVHTALRYVDILKSFPFFRGAPFTTFSPQIGANGHVQGEGKLKKFSKIFLRLLRTQNFQKEDNSYSRHNRCKQWCWHRRKEEKEEEPKEMVGYL